MKIFFLSLFLTLNTVIFSQYPSDNTELKKALIFGVCGQDGYYLTDLLLEKNYEVYGVGRNKVQSYKKNRILKEKYKEEKNFSFYEIDMTDEDEIYNLLKLIQPDEIYNLSAQSNVKFSFDDPVYTTEINSLCVIKILEAIKNLDLIKKIKFYQASSSELFGETKTFPQTETTNFQPRSPYGISKLYAYWSVVNYRDIYGLFACNGILYNHESPQRTEDFVTRKITLGACKCKLGLQNFITIGSLDSKRDWGYAKDYVEAMWMMMQNDYPSDFIISTGQVHSVREFIELAFKYLDIEIKWEGKGIDECGIDRKTNKVLVKIDPKFFRSKDTNLLVGDNSKAQRELNWFPKTDFKSLVKLMIESDWKLLTNKN